MIIMMKLNPLVLVYSLDVPGTFHSLVRGITQSIINAHNNMQEGRLFLAETEIENANINRSPSAYANNPEEEKAQ